MDDVEIVAENFLSCRACAIKALGGEQVARLASSTKPPGTSGGWMLPDGEVENGNPVQCDEHEDRQHWVLVC